MKKFFTLTLLLLLTAVTAVQAQVNFSVKYKRVNPTTIDIIFTGTAQPGWHIYSTNIGEGGPTRAEFGVDKIKGAKLKGSLKAGPGAKTMQDPIFEMPVTFFEGHATFTQRVELLDKDYELKGYLKYGACNDENCLPPTSVNAKVAGTDGPAPTAESKAEEAAAAAAQGARQRTDSGSVDSGYKGTQKLWFRHGRHDGQGMVLHILPGLCRRPRGLVHPLCMAHHTYDSEFLP